MKERGRQGDREKWDDDRGSLDNVPRYVRADGRPTRTRGGGTGAWAFSRVTHEFVICEARSEEAYLTGVVREGRAFALVFSRRESCIMFKRNRIAKHMIQRVI